MNQEGLPTVHLTPAEVANPCQTRPELPGINPYKAHSFPLLSAPSDPRAQPVEDLCWNPNLRVEPDCRNPSHPGMLGRQRKWPKSMPCLEKIPKMSKSAGREETGQSPSWGGGGGAIELMSALAHRKHPARVSNCSE